MVGKNQNDKCPICHLHVDLKKLGELFDLELSLHLETNHVVDRKCRQNPGTAALYKVWK